MPRKSKFRQAAVPGCGTSWMWLLRRVHQVRGGTQVLRVDGGASGNDLLMQLQADLLQVHHLKQRSVLHLTDSNKHSCAIKTHTW